MTVCEACGELAMNTLGPFCKDCLFDRDEWMLNSINENDDPDDEEHECTDECGYI